MALFIRKTEIFAKVETTKGTDATPTGSEAMKVSNVSISPYEGPETSRDFIRDYLGASTVIKTGTYVTLSFEVEIAGSGTADTAPAYSALLQACGFLETVNVATDVTFTPLSDDSSIKSVTIWIEDNGEMHKCTYGRGNVSFNMSTGTIPKMTFNFTALYTKPSASTLTADFSAFQSPLAVNDTNMGTFTLDSYSFKMKELNWDMGNNVVYDPYVGGDEVNISGRNVTGSILVQAPLIATKDVYAMVESHAGVTTKVLDVVHGSTAGAIIEVDMPAVQVNSISREDNNGIKMYRLGLIATPSSGNDEITFITK